MDNFINISVKGLNEDCNIKISHDELLLGLASNVERNIIRMIKTHIDQTYQYAIPSNAESGYALLPRTLVIFNINIIKDIMGFCERVWISGEPEQVIISRYVEDRSCEYHWVDITLSIAEQKKEVL